ncbi:LOW QUALITY PROTEIN: hypothetical protein YC2023_077527 [Brassica napus]
MSTFWESHITKENLWDMKKDLQHLRKKTFQWRLRKVTPGTYIIVFDPLDGSSNIDAAVSTGSILGIYSPNDECLSRRNLRCKLTSLPFIHPPHFCSSSYKVNKADLCLGQAVSRRKVYSKRVSAREQLASSWILYVLKLSHIFVLTLGKGVFAFTLDTPVYAGKIYSFNEGNYQMWDENMKKYIDNLKDPGPSGKPYSTRYIWSEIFIGLCCTVEFTGYPRDAKSKNGKLRLFYECAQMSFIVEQAGGKGSHGHLRVLARYPTDQDTSKGSTLHWKQRRSRRSTWLESCTKHKPFSFYCKPFSDYLTHLKFPIDA